MTYAVIGCSECSHHWIIEDLHRQDRCECPRCGQSRSSSRCKRLATADDREVACEYRAQINAKHAGKSDVYNDFCAEHGRYSEQRREVDKWVEQFTVDVELMDLKPIGADRFEEFVDDRPFYADAFAGEISNDSQAQLGWGRIEESYDAWRGDVDRDALPHGKINPTTQAQIEDALEIGTESFTDVWKTLFSRERVQTTVASCLDANFRPLDVLQAYDVLEDRGVPPWIRFALVDDACGVDEAEHEAAERFVELADQPDVSNEDLLVTASLAADDDATAPIAVRLGAPASG